MGYMNREKEVKILSTKSLISTRKIVEDLVKEIYPEYDYVIGDASDTYWNTPTNSKGDFARIRRKDNGAEVTIKTADKGGIVDRVEIDLPILDFKQGKIFLETLLGEPEGSVRKRYYVYFLEDSHTNISVYKVRGDERVFIEVEAKTLKRLEEICNLVKDKFEGLQRVNTSIYEMFIKKNDMITESL